MHINPAAFQELGLPVALSGSYVGAGAADAEGSPQGSYRVLLEDP